MRGNEDASQAQLDAVNARARGPAQPYRSAGALGAAGREPPAKLVEVSRSNVELATRALSDETDRVNAGVDDNLPLVTAQATLAQRREQPGGEPVPIQLSKLALARAAGVLETQYRDYIGR